MTARIQPGSAHDALDRLFEQAGGVKNAAAFLNVDEFRLHHARNPNDDRDIGWSRVCQLTAHFGATAAAEHLAVLAGGTFLPIAVEPETLHRLAARLSRENGEGIAALIEAATDPAKRTPAIKELLDVVRAALCGIVVLNNGAPPDNVTELRRAGA